MHDVQTIMEKVGSERAILFGASERAARVCNPRSDPHLTSSWRPRLEIKHARAPRFGSNYVALQEVYHEDRTSYCSYISCWCRIS
jgi:hypothetical protein